jgi:hypothetical protein
MQPMGSRQLDPKDKRCDGTGGLYGRDTLILYEPGIAGGSFRLPYRTSAGLATPILQSVAQQLGLTLQIRSSQIPQRRRSS